MDHRAMARIAGDPVQVRGWATAIRGRLGPDLSDRDRAFLETLVAFDGTEPLTVRQREFLDGLIKRTRRLSTVGGYPAAALVSRLYEARDDLDEDQAEAIARLRTKGVGLALSPQQWAWLFGLCRRLGLIDDAYIAIPGLG